MANEYVTAAALKATLSLTGETFADADVTAAVTSASRAIDGLTKRRFWADADANQVRYYRPISRDMVRIDDLATLTTLQNDPSGDGTYEETWVLNTDFTLEPDNASADGRPWELIRRHPNGSYLLSAFPRSVKVTGKFGWAAVPPEVTEATTILAARLVKRKREAPLGIVTVGIEQGAAMRVARNDPDVWGLISHLVRGGIGFA